MIQLFLPTLLPHQQKVVDQIEYNALMLTGRQWGKTTVGHELCIKGNKNIKGALQGKHIMWVAPDIPQARVIWNMLMASCYQLNDSINRTEKIIRFPGGGKIELRSAANPDSIRGVAVDGIFLDEAAYIKEDFYRKVLTATTLRKQGWIVMGTTPNGFGNWFYDFWQERAAEQKYNKTNWFLVNCPSSENPLLTPDKLAQIRKENPPAVFRQEYLGQFVNSADALFPDHYFDNIFIDEMPEAYTRRIISVDQAMGNDLKSDYTAVVFIGYQFGKFHIDSIIKRCPITETIEDIKMMMAQYNVDEVVWERNNFGQLGGEMFQLSFDVPPAIHLPWNKENKKTRIARLDPFLQRKDILFYNNPMNRLLVNQLRDFPRPDVHDDGADALVQGIETMRKVPFAG